MEQDKRTPSPALVEQYRKQMMELYRHQPAAATDAENWLDSRFPEPDVERDRSAITLPHTHPEPEMSPEPEVSPEPEMSPEPEVSPKPEVSPEPEMNPEPESPEIEEQPPVPDTPPIAETPFVGYLRVFVFTGEGAEPLSGAQVTVSREGTVYANTVSNRDGYTQVIPLPSVDPELTLRPGNPTPYVTYDIQVNADGFRPVRHENVPVYGNNYVTQPVSLLPLLPGADPDTVQNFVSGGPTNL